MVAQNKETRTVGAVPGLRSNDNRSNNRNSQAKPKQREYPEGWSCWVEPKTVLDVDEFLELWGTSIVTLGDDPEIDELELGREFDAWQRALHARKAVA